VPEQISLLQRVSLFGILHADGLEPSQEPWHLSVPLQGKRVVPRGCPDFTAVQVPTVPVSAQAWH
jgi:hypothetical protein